MFHKKTSANQADVILQEYNPIRLERFWIEASCHLSGLGKNLIEWENQTRFYLLEIKVGFVLSELMGNCHPVRLFLVEFLGA